MMSRLTELIDIDGMKIKTAKERPLSNQGLGEILHKLYTLENIEDELGCPLDVVFKAIKNGVHIKIDDEEIDIEGWKLSIFIEEQCFIINEMLFRTKLPFSDYQKTWWLKGDRSE